jgi:hypothetical protein
MDEIQDEFLYLAIVLAYSNLKTGKINFFACFLTMLFSELHTCTLSLQNVLKRGGS